MNRSQLILIAFLLLFAGFAGGWAAHRYIVLHRVHEVAEMRKARGFGAFLYERIQATPEQREQLQPIVHRYGAIIDSLHQSFNAERRATVEQMHEAIKPMLNDRQQEQLDRFSRRFREGRPGKKRRRH